VRFARRWSIGHSPKGRLRERSVDLYTRLIKPLEKHLQGIGSLLIAPDGEANLVPIGALVDEQGRYLVERYEITYLTSGRDLLRTGSAPTSSSPR